MEPAPAKNDEPQDMEFGGNLAGSSPPSSNGVYGANSRPDKAGKPPLAPVANDQPSEPKSHRRKISWGAQDVKNPPIPGIVQRQRSDISAYSQGINKGVHAIKNLPIPGIVQRQRSDVSALSQGINFPDGSQFSINLPYQGDNNTRRFLVDLPNDQGIVNPMETEAESYLLRAIELAGSEADSQSNILNNVPDQAVAAMNRKLSADNREFAPLKDARPATKTLLGNITSSSRANTSVRNLGGVPDVQHHRRNGTLDETLVGLSQAMDAIHAENDQPVLPRPVMQRVRSTSYGVRVRANTLDSSIGARTPVVPEGNEEDDDVLSPGPIGAAQPNYRVPILKTAKISGLIHRPTGKASESENDQSCDIEDGRSDGHDDDKKKRDDDNLSNEQTEKGGNTSVERKQSRWASTSSLSFYKWGVSGEMRNFIRPKQKLIRSFSLILIGYIAIPGLCAAAVLFYLLDNPPTGVLRNYGEPIDGKLINTSGQRVDPNIPSISFLLLFGVRQVITFGMALITQLFLIDYLAIDRGWLFKFGSRLPLFVMQAKGWPFVVFFWSIYDWGLLAGDSPFFSHWLHFQTWMALFNESNPDGNLIASNWNHRIIGTATGISLAVAIKRFWIAIFLGRQTYFRYSDKLATLMSKMLLISEVAGLSRRALSNIRKRETAMARSFTANDMDGLMEDAYEDDGSRGNDDSLAMTATTGVTGIDTMKTSVVIDPDDCNPYTGRLSSSQRNRITRLLGAWEEPNEDVRATEAMSIESLMHFRRAMTHLRNELPFSSSFGPAGSREDCVASSQEVFRGLMKLSDSDEVLNFEVIALLGAKSDGTLDQNKLMDLIRLFRPDRDGSLSMVHFVRSVDKVYKEVRMLRASVHNSSKVDGQFEVIFNFVFYLVAVVVALNVFGLDPFAIFVSISGLILGFAFMIGTASSKYFEGLLFILVRRPYGIGDCIHISDPNNETSGSGSPFWYVEDITLFATQVRFAFTNERASLSNGSLANSRIINSSKSNNAGVYHTLKFPLDVPYEKVKLFHEALDAFVRNRPREWIGLTSFRAVSVNAQLGFIEYIVCLDHRESWAYWSQVRTSQSDLMGFGVELAKKLDIVYKQPTLPINLNLQPQQADHILNQMIPVNPPPPLSPMADGEGGGFLEPSAYSREFQNLAAQFPHRNPSSKMD